MLYSLLRVTCSGPCIESVLATDKDACPLCRAPIVREQLVGKGAEEQLRAQEEAAQHERKVSVSLSRSFKRARHGLLHVLSLSYRDGSAFFL